MWSRNVGRGVRFVSLALILVVGGWLLMPPPNADSGLRPGSRETKREHVRYTIRFSPGYYFMPGTIPFGIGNPLHGITDVVRKFEERFPDTHIAVVDTPGVREYLVTQLSSGRAPDIVNVNVEDVWTDVQKGWYLPLDSYLNQPNPFVREQGNPNAPGYKHWWDMFRYQAISRGKAAPDGLMYCLSYDMVETGLFYNKNIFKKVGVQVPKNWDQFIAVCKKLKAAGYIPILMNIDEFADWCTDLFFDQLYRNLLPGIDLYSDPRRAGYLKGYLDWDEICFLHKHGFFTPQDKRWRALWQIMKNLRQYTSKNIVSTDMTRDFVTQKAAMYWMSCQFTYRLTADHDLGFKWGVFYPPQFTKHTSKYACNVPMCVIGGSADQFEVTNSAYSDTGNPKTSKRLKRVIAFLQFLCLPKNCNHIVNEYPCLVPNIVGVPVSPSLKPFEKILERRYTTTKWLFTFDLKFSYVQRRMLELYLDNGLSLDQYLASFESNLNEACANAMRRKPINWQMLQASWDAKAPARAHMKDLPNG